MEFVIRAHHIFCIQGFRGKGYSKEFVSNMTTIVDYLNKNKDVRVKLLNSSDHICLGCPNNVGQSEMRKFEVGQTYEDRGFCENESQIVELDNMVLETLGVKADSDYLYSELLNKIKENLTRERFKYICGDCKWYSLGYCSESLFSKNIKKPT